jgi:hypothetical protein
MARENLVEVTMVVAWIVAVWLLSLTVFVALRAYGTRGDRTPGERRAPSGESGRVPAQREPSDSPARLTDQA